jgi:DASH complex subunit ASK1
MKSRRFDKRVSVNVKMARPSMAAPRNLSLTEELEKLEQRITLTLQEIDSNFAKAHRIVTASILPIVERYAQNSDAVWEGSKVRIHSS